MASRLSQTHSVGMGEMIAFGDDDSPMAVNTRRTLAILAIALPMGLGFLMLGRQNYLLFHVFTELSCVAVAWGVFLLIWNTRTIITGNAVLLLGIAYLFVGLMDLLHTLSYRGMGLLTLPVEGNIATQLWVATRYLESISLLAFALLVRRHVPTWPTLLLYAVVTALLVSSILFGFGFPDCYLEGEGLTPFKKISEYVICTIIFTAMVVLFRQRSALDRRVFQLIALSSALTIASEIFFTTYVGLYELSNQIGHVLKVASFFLIYLALIESGVRRPYSLLFRKLRENRLALESVSREQSQVLDHLPDVVAMLDNDNRILWANKAARTSVQCETLQGQRCFDVWGDGQLVCGRCPVVAARKSGQPENGVIAHEDGRVWHIRALPMRDPDGTVTRILEVAEDISARNREALLRERLLETTQDAYWTLDNRGCVVEANHAAAKLLDYTLDELIGMHVSQLDVLEDVPSAEEHVRSIMDIGFDRFETRQRRKDGSELDVEVSASFLPIDGGRVIAFVRDISERKRVEEEREVTIRLLHILGSDTVRSELAENLLKCLCDWSGCEAVGIRLQVGKEYPYFAAKGFPPGFIELENQLCPRDHSGRLLCDANGEVLLDCVCGAVIQGRIDSRRSFYTEHGSFWTNNASELVGSGVALGDIRGSRGRCYTSGFESAALIPLRDGERVVGLLQFDDRQKDKFSKERILQFERVAASVALGLARHSSAVALKESEQFKTRIIESSLTGFYLYDFRSRRFDMTTEQFERLTGLNSDSLGSEGENLFDALVHAEDLPILRGHRESLQSTNDGKRLPVEYRLRKPDGSCLWCLCREMVYSRLQDGSPRTIVGSLLDVTREKRLILLAEARTRLSQFAITHSLREVMQAALDEAEVLTESSIGFYHFLDRDQQTLKLQAWSTNTLHHMCSAEGQGSHYRVSEAGVWADCIRERTAVIHNDYASLSHRKGTPPGHAPVVRQAVVPVFRGEYIVAILGVGNKSTSYTSDDIDMLTEFSDRTWDLVERKLVEASLREREEMYRALVENVPDTVMRFDHDCRHLYLSGPDSLFREVPAERHIGETHRSLGYPVGICDQWETAILHVFQEREPVRLEIEMPGGSWLDCILAPEHGERGDVVAVCGSARDVTEMKEAQFALNQSLTRLKAENDVLTELATHPSVSQGDLHAVARWVTERAAAALGVERAGIWLLNERCDELRCVDLFHASRSEHCRCADLTEVEFASEFAYLRENKFVDANDPLTDPRTAGHVDGYIVPASIAAKLDAAIRTSGRCVGTLCFEHVGKSHTWQQDEIAFACQIADQIAIAVMNRESAQVTAERERLMLAVQQTQESVIITGADGVIRFVNAAFERSTGYTRDEACGQTPRILKSGVHDGVFYRDLWARILAGDTWQGRLVNKKKDGTIFTEEATISPVRNGSGSITHFISVKRDISKDLEVEEHLRQAQKMEAIGTLAGGIAHDFNNILGAIVGYSEILRDELIETQPSALAELDEVLKASYRARDLVSQIMAFSRKAESQKRPLRLSALIKEVHKLLRGAIPSTVEIKYTPGRGVQDTVLADATQIHQVIMNLCTNAWQAMQEDGGTLGLGLHNVTITADDCFAFDDLAPGAYVVLSVSDTGCGIALENLPRVFEPFFTTKAPGEGTGMGLSVVHGVVKSHDGTILLDSCVGEGTTFRVFLPCIEIDRDEKRIAREEPLPSGTERVLLIDDEAALLQVISRMLTSLGYSVTSCQGGQQALDVFAEGPEKFDLVITDLTMPRITGIAVAQRIRAIRPAIPILLCTGFGEGVTPESMRTSGFNHILFKPVMKDRLAEAVRSVLDQASSTH